MTVYPSGGGTVTGPAIAAAGGLLAANNLTDLANAATARRNLVTTHAVQCTNAAAGQAFASGVFTTVTWDTEDFDTDAYHAGASGLITVPAGLAGKYLCIAQIQTAWTVGTAGNFQIKFRKNAAVGFGISKHNELAGIATDSLFLCELVDLAVGDTIEVSVFNDGTAPTMRGNADAQGVSFFSAMFVGP